MYYDRLIDNSDRAWLHKKLKELVKGHFKEDFNGLFRHLAQEGSGSNVCEDDMRSLMFGDYMQPDAVSPATTALNNLFLNVTVCLVL